MPTLSEFRGIKIIMRKEKGAKHHSPHIHARYQGCKASVDIASRKPFAVGKRGFPEDQMNMIKSWIAIHESELYQDWEMLETDGKYFKIPPLM